MTTQTDSTMKRWNEELDALVRGGSTVAAAAKQLLKRTEYSTLMAVARSPAIAAKLDADEAARTLFAKYSGELEALQRDGVPVLRAVTMLSMRSEFTPLFSASFDVDRAAKDPTFIRCQVQVLEPQERERVVAELRKVGVKFKPADEADDDFISLARDLFISETSEKYNAELAATIEREQLPAYAVTTLLLRKPLYASLWALCLGYNGSHGGHLNR